MPLTPTPPRGRFAPSPTGALHAGSLLAALGSWLFARHVGGEWHVRIEDIDPPREVAGAADAQLHVLARLGLQPDGPVLRQSTRGALYAQALERLLDQGDAFVCHCSRSALAAHAGVHRRCVGGAPRRDPSIRLRVPQGTRVAFEDAIQGHVAEDVHAVTGDFVLRRVDGYWAYQLAVVVDDAAQGMTDIVRGLVHGMSDDNVHFQHTAEMARALIDAGKTFDTMYYPNDNHAIGTPDSKLHLFRLITEFIKENL